eukprot:1144066-Pelagomonas_calceolata.AAC.1
MSAGNGHCEGQPVPSWLYQQLYRLCGCKHARAQCMSAGNGHCKGQSVPSWLYQQLYRLCGCKRA